jgi:DNA-directed RNA polymerase I subunit RPA49
MLPYRRSDFIATKMRQLLPSRASAEGNVPNPSKRDRERLRLVVHLSYLFQFRNTARPGQLVDRAKLVERLGNPSNAVVDALLERYTEKVKGGAGGDEARKVTTTMELKLLTYMLVIALKLDGWSTDVETMANDLGMGTKRCVLRS